MLKKYLQQAFKLTESKNAMWCIQHVKKNTFSDISRDVLYFSFAVYFHTLINTVLLS